MQSHFWAPRNAGPFKQEARQLLSSSVGQHLRESAELKAHRNVGKRYATRQLEEASNRHRGVLARV